MKLDRLSILLVGGNSSAAATLQALIAEANGSSIGKLGATITP